LKDIDALAASSFFRASTSAAVGTLKRGRFGGSPDISMTCKKFLRYYRLDENI
jgi:hypothetical protein